MVYRGYGGKGDGRLKCWVMAEKVRIEVNAWWMK
jgi:hypothetical protein